MRSNISSISEMPNRVRTASASAVASDRRSDTSSVSRNAAAPMANPEPSSPRAKSQPPKRRLPWSRLAANTDEPVPAITATAGAMAAVAAQHPRVSATAVTVAESGTVLRTPPMSTSAWAWVSTDALVTSTAVTAGASLPPSATASAITPSTLAAAASSPAERLLVGPPSA